MYKSWGRSESRLNYQVIIKRFVPAFVLLFLFSTEGNILSVQNDFLSDNAGFLINVVSLEQKNINLKWSNVGWRTSFEYSGHAEKSYGFGSFYRKYFSAQANIGKAWSWIEIQEIFGIKDSAGRSFLPFAKSLLTSSSIKLTIPSDANNFFVPYIKGNFDYKTADDNPALSAMGVKKLKYDVTLGAKLKTWEVAFTYTQERFPSIDKNEFSRFLEDSLTFWEIHNSIRYLNNQFPSSNPIQSEVDPIPANRIDYFSTYCYGQVFPWAYLGAYGSYKNALKNNWIITGVSKDSNFTFGNFPYITQPKTFLCAGVILALARYFESTRTPLSGASIKLNIPIFSSSEFHGYYMDTTDTKQKMNLMDISDIYYRYNGIEPLKADVDIYKTFGQSIVVRGSYSLYLKPYLSYGYFNSQKYWYNEFKVVFEKKL